MATRLRRNGSIQRKPGGDHEMVELLSLVLHHVMPEACLQHDEQEVLCAGEMALEAGVPPKSPGPRPIC